MHPPRLRPQCVPQDRNQPFHAAIAGQADPWNPLHLCALLDLPCHVLTTRFRLDKAEVTGSSPVSPTRSAVQGVLTPEPTQATERSADAGRATLIGSARGMQISAGFSSRTSVRRSWTKATLPRSAGTQIAIA